VTPKAPAPPLPPLPCVPTGIPGLDPVLGGGLLSGDLYLITGDPGTGKTTLGTQIAFARAAAGDTVLYVTLQTETHDRMLAHLANFTFVDRTLIGSQLHFRSLLAPLRDRGLDGMLDALQQAASEHRADLIVIDGAGTAGFFADSGFDLATFVHRLQGRLTLLGATTLLLAGRDVEAAVAPHVDGVIALRLDPVGASEVRWLRVPKLRGSRVLPGDHRIVINETGLRIYPRLETALQQLEPPWGIPRARLGFGDPGLDTMLAGGLPERSSTMLMGSPGAGKTVLGLQFIAEGAHQGEPGVIAAFHETAAGLAATAELAGLTLGPHLASGLVQVLWTPPLQLVPDAWASQLLALLDEHQPRRLVVDAFSDIAHHFVYSERQRQFATALTSTLRARDITSLFTLELDVYVSPQLAAPVPAISSAVDNGILLRTVELRSRLHRLISILKLRQSNRDPTIREFTIGPAGIAVGEPFDARDLLTGSADPF
jgi:circadian clock protein KaiC